MEKEHKHITVPYGIYFSVWLSLVLLTIITVTVSGFNLGTYTVATALLIALVKAGLVFNIFMHLKYDKPYLKWMLLVAISTLLFMFIVFFDLSYR
jgi:cytochrome c oxidase subunit 4